MKQLLDKVEKYLIRGVVLGVVALVVVQALLTKEPLRFYLSLGERLEGQSIEYPASSGTGKVEKPGEGSPQEERAISPWGELTISLREYSSLAQAKVLVNNEEVASFRSQDVKIKVMGGDVVEIDATYYNFPVTFEITGVSSNLAAPCLHQSFTTSQGMAMIGKVIVK